MTGHDCFDRMKCGFGDVVRVKNELWNETIDLSKILQQYCPTFHLDFKVSVILIQCYMIVQLVSCNKETLKADLKWAKTYAMYTLTLVYSEWNKRDKCVQLNICWKVLCMFVPCLFHFMRRRALKQQCNRHLKCNMLQCHLLSFIKMIKCSNPLLLLLFPLCYLPSLPRRAFTLT